MIDKAVAVVPHPGGAPLRCLVFDHPLAGAQIVKGTVEPGERPLIAARRELWEEAGLVARSGVPLCISDAIVSGEVWHFSLLRVALPVAEAWDWHTTDGGGLTFRCRWQALTDDGVLSGRFLRAWHAIRAALA